MTEQVTAERIAKIHQLIDQHAYCDCYDSRQHEPGCPQPAFRDLLLALDAAQTERDEAQRRLSAAKGEVDFHQQRTVFFEAECARLRAQGTDVASRLEMACKRMSVGSGARTRFEANRAGQREAYFASARLVRELFPAPRDTEGA